MNFSLFRDCILGCFNMWIVEKCKATCCAILFTITTYNYLWWLALICSYIKWLITNVTLFAKSVLYVHSLMTHLSAQFNGYNNRLTVHVCTTVKSWTVCFYSERHSDILECSKWSLNCSGGTWQTVTQLEITTQIFSDIGCWFGNILW